MYVSYLYFDEVEIRKICKICKIYEICRISEISFFGSNYVIMSSSLRQGTRIVSRHVQSSIRSVSQSSRVASVTTKRESECRNFGNNNLNNYDNNINNINNNNRNNKKHNEKRFFSTASASHEQSVNAFPSIIIGADTLSPQGSFAEAQAHVSNKASREKCDADDAANQIINESNES